MSALIQLRWNPLPSTLTPVRDMVIMPIPFQFLLVIACPVHIPLTLPQPTQDRVLLPLLWRLPTSLPTKRLSSEPPTPCLPINFKLSVPVTHGPCHIGLNLLTWVLYPHTHSLKPPQLARRFTTCQGKANQCPRVQAIAVRGRAQVPLDRPTGPSFQAYTPPWVADQS